MALLQVYSSVNTKKLVISSVYFYILYVVVLPVFLSSSFWGVHKSIFHQHFSSTSQLMSSLQCTSALMEIFCIKLLNLIQQVTMNHLVLYTHGWECSLVGVCWQRIGLLIVTLATVAYFSFLGFPQGG